jgi:SAM-dependent methyltransferase
MYAEPHLLDCPDYYMQMQVRVSYYRCSACGLVQQSPVPKDTSAWYGAYPVHQRKNAMYDVLRGMLMSGCYYDTSRLAPGCRLLDFGCGDGAYLAWCRRDGVERVGFEPCDKLAAVLANRLGCSVYSNLAALQREREATFDVVTMHHVLEHVSDLHGTFAMVHRLLKPGGVFYVLVPHVESWEARLFKRRWHGLDPPRHISFPNADTLERLAADHRFTLERERAIPFPNGLAGSVPAAIFGRYMHPVFLALMPFAFFLAHLAPSGFRGYWLRRL